MSTIPSSQLSNVTPSVLAAGGSNLAVNGLVLDNTTRVPLGEVLSFPDQPAVAAYFGAASKQAALAAIYFGGFEGADVLPQAQLWTQYNESAVSAYLRGGSMAAISVATLQGYSGTLSVTIDGTLKTANINLSSATSFSNAAELIANDLGIEGVQAASFTAAIAATVMTVSAVATGTLSVGDVVLGSGVTGGTYITSLGTGTGGTGTYNVSVSQTVGSEAMTADTPAVQFDSVSQAFIILSGTTGVDSTISFGSGALATDLLLTQATGAVLSQGAVAATPSAFMTAVVLENADWVTFMTDFDPDGGSGNTVKQEFAAWKNTQNSRFAYVCWDTDITPTEEVPATESLGYILGQNGDSGTCLIYEATDLNLAAFICGAAASIDFNEEDGRITFAYKAQAGLSPSVTDPTTAVNLGGNPQVEGDRGNGYNFYGAYGSANLNTFTWFQRGFVTGPFQWLDSYINQVYFNNQFQVAMLTLMGTVKSIPYTQAGSSLIEQALAPIIQQGLTFGAWAPGTISSAQAAEVNGAAGANISSTLQSQGYYLQVLPASAAVRASRGSPPCTFWYLDRGSVQSINLASVAVQ